MVEEDGGGRDDDESTIATNQGNYATIVAIDISHRGGGASSPTGETNHGNESGLR